MRLVFRKFFPIVFIFCCLQWLSAQYVIPQKPPLLYPIYDEVGLLSTAEKEKLNQKLIKFENSTSTEIEVIIISSTLGEDVNFLATKFGEQWGIGKKNTNNGVVFLIATKDRTMSIQQGRSVEQHLTASTAGQILDYLVTPNFKKGNFYQGIDAGTSAIMEALQGKFKPEKKENTDNQAFKIFLIAFIIFIILAAIISSKGNDFDNDDDDDITLSRRGRTIFFPTNLGSRRGGFGGSSGGFGGFGGGGSFGGGGASGGW